ncbi:hypothetical protein DPMN_108100 [Dreissena polymorpha]|uniref:Uncharacterized protein n=1 Tax=Dreissena polymorpha TaxID=45954 RepID=A0A9D4QLP5_DREPO|nr:hypothetical protein DPMN_108100 [Dreissena polymorpha]
MPLTSGTTCHRDDSNIGHNMSQRCHSHRALRVTDMPLTSDKTRTEIPPASNTT